MQPQVFRASEVEIDVRGLNIFFSKKRVINFLVVRKKVLHLQPLRERQKKEVH